jgi:hypothetical protein
MPKLLSGETIENKIFFIRGQRVMLDFDLATLYGIETKYLKRQVKRNLKRFPKDFMFQLSKEENLRCQFVTSSYGGRRHLPFAFTEQGVAMLSSVLNSERAIAINIIIMRAFVKIRKMLTRNRALALKIKTLEKTVAKGFKKHDHAIQALFDTIKKLLSPPKEKPKKIGFFRNDN